MRYGGSRLVGREYYLGERPVRVLIGWGPGAPVRNVKVLFLDDGTTTVRPFRGLTLEPQVEAECVASAPVEPENATTRRRR